jgi:plastocyanin
MVLRVGVATVLALALGAAAAYADQTIFAAPPSQFVGGDITIAQGEKVTFTNGDTTAHDVTATGAGPDGKPLFASGNTAAGQSNVVAGTEYLTTGTYQYVCTIHSSFMKGTVTVSSDGTPKPRPGGGGGGGGSSPPPQSAPSGDTTAPSVQVKVLDTKKSKIRKRRSLQLSITSSEAAAVKLVAKSGGTVVASGKGNLPDAGTKKVSIKLTKAGLKLVKKSKTVKIAVSTHAVDGAGNASDASASGRLR